MNETTTPMPTTVESLTAAVRADTTDRTAQLVLADAIMEQDGVSRSTAVKRVRGIVRAAEDAALSPRSVARWLKGSNMDAFAIGAALAVANGRRRERTLSYEEIMRRVRRVAGSADTVATWEGGGTVANAYKYPAYQTACVVAKRTDGTLRIAVGQISARKGTSLTNWATGLTVNATAEQFQAWADADRVSPPAETVSGS